MIYMLPVNAPDPVNGSVTYMRLDFGDISERVAKRKLRIILAEWGVPVNQMKKFINDLRKV